MVQFLELLTTILALIIGLVFYKKFNLFYRFLFFQALVYFLFDCFAMVVSINYGNNVWVYNILIPIEAVLLFEAAQKYLKARISPWMLLILFVFFLGIYVLEIFNNGIYSFAYHAVIVEGLIVCVIYIAMLYFHFFENYTTMQSASYIVAIVGILIYFACITPYLCIMTNLYRTDSALGDMIFVYIIIVTGSIRYLFLAVAFFMFARKKFTP